MLFEFNLYSGLLLPPVIQGLLFTVLLFWRSWRQERTSDWLLAIIILIYTLRVSQWMLGFAGWYDSHDGYTTFMFYFPFTYWLALGPCLYFFFRSLTDQQFQFQRKHLLHFFPIFLELLIDLGLFLYEIVYQHWLLNLPLTGHFATRGELVDQGIPVLTTLLQIGIYISILTYAIITIRLYKAYSIYISDYFSDTENIQYQWVRNLLYAIILGIVIWLSFQLWSLITNTSFSYMQSWYSYFAWGIIIYYISIQGYYSTTIASKRQLQFSPQKKVVEAIATEEVPSETTQLKQSIEDFIQQHRVYLESDLSLHKLAAALQISPTQLSKVINTAFGKNFNEFINGFRVEEMQRKLLDPQYEHLSILGIAMECGFRSKATLNRVFKQQTGLSPSEYVRQQRGG